MLGSLRRAPRLGVDLQAGHRGGRLARVKRMQKAKTACSRIRGFARASKRYLARLELERASAQAAAALGHEIFGTFGRARLQFRQRCGAAGAAAGHVKRIAAVLQLRLGAGDPAR